MNPLDESREEEQIAALLAAANQDLPPPDRAFLDQLRDTAAQAFATAHHRRRKRMQSLTIRLVWASAAAAVLATVFLIGRAARDRTAPALDEVLARVAAQDSAHFQLTRLGQTSDAWMAGANRLRVDRPTGTYELVLGQQLWEIDEKANRATPRPSPYFRDEQGGTDLLALLKAIPAAERERLRQLRPRVPADNSEVAVYELESTSAEGDTLRIEAQVDRRSQLLHSLRAVRIRNGQVQPLAELTALAYNAPVAAENFMISDTLTEDGRIGKVTDAQGIVSLKPAARERWTPVGIGLLLRPGDWIRTDVRGANAVALRLMKQTKVILGPGSLAELIKPDQIKLLSGEIEIEVPAGKRLELLDPKGTSTAVQGTRRLRVRDQRLTLLDSEPLWLRGFKSQTANESIGSLIAKIDGRNVPLTVGSHKVSVDIRDQIARTVIEESFVNRTDLALEGVFYFPLPADASIAGFGMWVGDQLIEADVVEKQRAREIYETIKSERRDPGLLEWTGGNLFKANIFPIPAHGEKRIRITYTQVLPLRGQRYRYSYGLLSDLLKLHPLRELAIDVRISSALPIANITSPTHPTRIDHTEHAGRVEFTAQEYTPDRDFEVVVEVAGRHSDVVFIPHRRGEDGYFLLELMPPAPAGDWDRVLLPDGEPLDLRILADTSASMDANQRKEQQAVIAALLSSLTPRDTFNLAASDVNCDWAFAKPVPGSEKEIGTAKEFLSTRASLGWTNLDQAFASALAQAGPRTHLIYVGDGIVTAPETDAAAFARRLARLTQGKSVTGHAIAVGNNFEVASLQAMARVGSGSLRRVTGEQGPQAIALNLLSEIAQPGMRDVKVEFSGIRTARVYPEVLPNIPAGTQQIILGRYSPEGRDQAGEVLVSAVQDGKPVQYRTRVSFKDAEEGNSFIPRLWARMHLDYLLAQGRTDLVRDQVIALSEEYQIITPYTSFLVLETDADRERFKVKRTFRMRDGERFFAEGRDQARLDLLQKQMKLAGEWRLGLRRTAMANLTRSLRPPLRLDWPGSPFDRLGDALPGLAGEPAGGRPMGSASGVGGGDCWPMARETDDLSGNYDAPASGPSDGLAVEEQKKELADEDLGGKAERAEASETVDGVDDRETAFPAEQGLALGLEPDIGRLRKGALHANLGGELDKKSRGGFFFARPGRPEAWAVRQWLDRLFPPLPSPTRQIKDPRPGWPAPARDLARSLLRTEALGHLKGGLELQEQNESLRPRDQSVTFRSASVRLISPREWVVRDRGDRSQTLVQWCDTRERGILSAAFQLGRTRPSKPADLQDPPLDLGDYSVLSLEQAYATLMPVLTSPGKGRTLLTLKTDSDARSEIRILVDTERHHILTIEHVNRGKITSQVEFADLIDVAGTWWPQRIDTRDEQGQLIQRQRLTIRELSAEAFGQRIQQELQARGRVQLLRQPLPNLLAAKRAIQERKATFDDQFALVLDYAQSQQWSRALEHLERAMALAPSKAGLRWVRDALYVSSRRHEEVHRQLQQEARNLVEAVKQRVTSGDDFYVAEYIIGQGAGILEAHETLGLLDLIQPVYQKGPADEHLAYPWLQHRAGFYQIAGQTKEALELYRRLATEQPRDVYPQEQYARFLSDAGEPAAGRAWLLQKLAEKDQWNPGEVASLRQTYATLLENEGRYADLAKFVAGWIETNPDNVYPYAIYLAALLRADQEPEAEKRIRQWLTEGSKPGEIAPAALARLEAAAMQILGRGHNWYASWMDPRWEEPLAQVVLAVFRDPDRTGLAHTIINWSTFAGTDACQEVRKQLAKILAAEIATLPPATIHHVVGWVGGQGELIPAQTRQTIRTGLAQRWEKESQARRKQQLGDALVEWLRREGDEEAQIAFLRRRYREGPVGERAKHAQALFDQLLGRPWSEAIETELFDLLPALAEADDVENGAAASVVALYQLTDRLVQNRHTALMKQVKHPEKLTRSELRKQEADALRKARSGVAQRLRTEAAKSTRTLADWLTIERLYLETLLGDDPQAIAATCWEFLRLHPERVPVSEGEATAASQLAQALRHRYLRTLAHLAAQKNANGEAVDRVLKTLEAEDSRTGDSSPWKSVIVEILLARDQPRELAQTLNRWIGLQPVDSRWRLMLGYLLAEQGKIAEAIRLVEAVETLDELGPFAYRALANWYLVTNQRAEHDRAQMQALMVVDEYTLSRRLWLAIRPWQSPSGMPPTEIDADTLRTFTVLFKKASAPQNYLNQLQQFYQYTRDFRLLTGLADAVVGHTAERVYPFLMGMRSVLGEIHDEATVDQVMAHLAEVRSQASSPLDRRAFDLLELLVQRRAVELKNQPGPHADRALAALRRALKGAWLPGEPRLMADLLAGMGPLPSSALAAEQVQDLQTLWASAKAGTFDRLHIAQQWAEVLRGLGRTSEGVDQLQNALGEFAAANGGVLPTTARDAIAAYLSLLESLGHYVEGEKFLRQELRHPASEQHRLWLTERLDETHLHAFSNDAETSLGKGAVLYQALERLFRADLRTAPPGHRRSLLDFLTQLYLTAKRKTQAGVSEDALAFAFKEFPELPGPSTSDYLQAVRNLARTLHEVAGPREAIRFLVERIAAEPTWVHYMNEDIWYQDAWQLAEWRKSVKDLGPVEPAFRRLLSEELRRDLEIRQRRTSAFVDRRSGYFLPEYAAMFAQVAEEVLARHRHSPAATQYIADYFAEGLGQMDHAIDILFDALKRNILPESGQALLVKYLQQQKRFAESIPLLLALREAHPNGMGYCVDLMRAYHQTGQEAKLRELLKATDAYFRGDDRWNEGALAALARSSLENQLFKEAVAYLEELIPWHQRTAPRQGIGDGVLSDYYRSLAQAYAGLNETAQAVEAACGAIVSWGPRQDQRKEALQGLVSVVRQTKDLDAYVALLDRESSRTGLHSAVVRKALGQVYRERNQFAKARVQLQLAAELQPNDTEIWDEMVAVCDAEKDSAGAVQTLLRSLEVRRRDIKAFETLGRRFSDLHEPNQAERAFTSVIDVQPNEPESHALLAEIRQSQARWGEAISEWENVVRLRPLEPTGLLKLSQAQMHERRWEAAQQSLQKLASKSWPARFGDVAAEVRKLQEELTRVKGQ